MEKFIDNIKKRAAARNRTIVLPESYDERVAEAAIKIAEEGFANVVLLSERNKDLPFYDKLNSHRIKIIDYLNSELFEGFVQTLYEMRKKKGVTLDEARNMVADPIYFGTMMVKTGLVDGMVSGACHSTADILRPALQIIKTAEGVKTVSAFFVMVVPNTSYGHNGVLVFGDAGLVEFPTEDQLMDIAVASAKSFENLIEAEPRVALLSYSTKGSGQNERLQPVISAAERLKKKYPNLKVDGELQLDAAIEESVAKLKAPGSKVAGHANVLIFPDLNSGNIGYKLVQRFAGAEAYGPITQGLKRPINDLSRGCNVDDIVGVVAITCLQA